LASFTGCTSDASGKVRADDGSISTESPNAPVTPTCSVTPGLEGVGGFFLSQCAFRGIFQIEGDTILAGSGSLSLTPRVDGLSLSLVVLLTLYLGCVSDVWPTGGDVHRIGLWHAGSFCILFSPSYIVSCLINKPYNLSQFHEIDYYTANNSAQLISINNNHIYQPVDLSLFQKCPYNIWERH